MTGIYKFTNKINGKVYIGKSDNIERRYKQHLKSIKGNEESFFYRALRKYGIENFDFDVLLECNSEDLNYWETFYIKEYKSNVYEYGDSFGYNMTPGGDGVHLYGEHNGMYGKNHTEESKKLMSENKSGKPLSSEHIQKIHEFYETHDGPMKGKHHTHEAKEKNRQAHLGKPTWIKCKHHTHEAKEKNKQAHLGKPVWNSGKEQKSHMTEETLENCREAGRVSGSKLWIYKGNDKPKRCFKEELDYYISLGYKRGRGSTYKPANYSKQMVKRDDGTFYYE